MHSVWEGVLEERDSHKTSQVWMWEGTAVSLPTLSPSDKTQEQFVDPHILQASWVECNSWTTMSSSNTVIGSLNKLVSILTLLSSLTYLLYKVLPLYVLIHLELYCHGQHFILYISEWSLKYVNPLVCSSVPHFIVTEDSVLLVETKSASFFPNFMWLFGQALISTSWFTYLAQIFFFNIYFSLTGQMPSSSALFTINSP